MLVNYNYEDLIEVYLNPDLWIGDTNDVDPNGDVRFGKNYIFTKTFLTDLSDDIGLIQPVDLLIKDHISSEKINKLTYGLDFYGKGIAEGLQVTQSGNDISITKGVAIVDNCVIKIKNDVSFNINNDYSNLDYLHTGRYYLVLRYEFDRDNPNSKAYFDLVSKKDFTNKYYENDPTVLVLGILYIIREHSQTIDIDEGTCREKKLLDEVCNESLPEFVFIYSTHGKGGCTYPYGYVPVVKTTSSSTPSNTYRYDGSRQFNGSFYVQVSNITCAEKIQLEHPNWTWEQVKQHSPKLYFDRLARFNGLNRFDGIYRICDRPDQDSSTSSVTFVSIPEEKYQLENIKIDEIYQGRLTYYTFKNITRSHFIHSEYDLIDTYIIAESIGPGNIYPGGKVKVKWGHDQEFIILPDEDIDVIDYTIKDVIVDGQHIGPTALYKFEDVRGAHSITAIFEELDKFNYYIVDVAITSNSGGMIYPYGKFKIQENQNIKLIISTDYGYEVKSFAVNGTLINLTSNVYEINNINEDLEIRVEFGIIENQTYEINVQYNEDELDINIDTNKIIIPQAESKLISFKPKEGYCIENVFLNNEDLGKIDEILISYNNVAVYNLIINTALNCAICEIDTFKIKETHNEGGNVYPVGGIEVPEKTDITFRFEPDDGYIIEEVLVNGISYKDISQYTFTNIDRNQEIEVKFKQIQYEITIEGTEGGKIEPYGKLFVNDGEELIIKIDPDQGYIVESIEVDGLDIGSNTTYRMENIKSDHRVYVKFIPKVFVIHVSSKGKGLIYPDHNVVVKYGEEYEFIFKPEQGFRVKDVIVNGYSQGKLDKYKFTTIDRDSSIFVEFEPDVYIIKTESSEGGKIIPSGNVIVPARTRQEFRIQPNPGYIVDNIQADGQNVGPATRYEFNDIQEDHQLIASFKQKPTNNVISISASSGGIVDPIGRHEIQDNGSIKIVIKANVGYKIDKILDNGQAQTINDIHTDTYMIDPVTEDHDINIIFKSE